MSDEPVKVLFVCLGNICRSPMAEGVMRRKREELRLNAKFHVESAGTGAWHVGEPPDPRTIQVLQAHDAPIPGPAQQVQGADFERFDHVLAMDRSNYRRLQGACPTRHMHKLSMMLEPTRGGDVPDPYYGGDGGFERVYDMLDEALDVWIPRWVEGG